LYYNITSNYFSLPIIIISDQGYFSNVHGKLKSNFQKEIKVSCVKLTFGLTFKWENDPKGLKLIKMWF